MTAIVLVDNVSKQYQLGESRGSLREAIWGLGRTFLRSRANRDASVVWALKDVSFEINPGEALGVIGPNGAGKTTTLKLLANVTQPTSGRITVSGRVSALIELGAGFHPDLSGRENIYLNAAILGLSRKQVDRLFDRIVMFSGLERFIDTPVKRYSSGMYVRLGFAVAAHVEPDVLLVDEVLAVGDAEFRQRCVQRIEELRSAGTTIVVVAHNLYLVKSICDKAIFLAEGRVQAEGDVVSVINAYETWLHTRQTQTFLDKSVANLDSLDSSTVDVDCVEVRNLNKVGGSRIGFDDAIEVRVHFRAKQPFRNPNLVLRIIRDDRVTCCMIRTADYGYVLDALEGEGVISIAIDPLQLAGGAYVIDARLMGPVDGVPLAEKHSQWFQVNGLSFGHEESSGVFVSHLAWARVEQNGRGNSDEGTLTRAEVDS